MYIKCCGFKEKESIDTAIDHHVDAIGFITFPKSKRYVSINEIKNLSHSIPGNIDKVAVVVNPSIEEVKELVETTTINTIQFHGDEDIEFIKQVQSLYPHLKVFKAIPANEQLPHQIQTFKNHIDLFLIDTPSTNYGGTGISFDWSILKAIDEVPYLIAGGLDLEKINHIESLKLNNIGYDISSGIETNGKKDNYKIKTLLTNLKG
nr:phosphoribosylanthranilate isomerase [Mammaliicoccus sp. Marseille-Q6498]